LFYVRTAAVIRFLIQTSSDLLHVLACVPVTENAAVHVATLILASAADFQSSRSTIRVAFTFRHRRLRTILSIFIITRSSSSSSSSHADVICRPR